MLHLRVIGTAEAKRIEIRDWASAHRKDVAQDAAYARRGALIRFDVGGMVVALHLEDRGEFCPVRPFADIDDAGIFTWTLNHPGCLGWQLLQMNSRALVGAMFR